MGFILSYFGWQAPKLADLQQRSEVEQLSYLSARSHPELERSLCQALRPEKISTLAEQLLNTSPQLLDTCLKVCSLETLKAFSQVQDVEARASREAVFRPKPKPVSLASRITANLSLQPGVASKVVTYVSQLVSWTYSVDLENPPRNYWSAQNQWMFFRSLLSDSKLIGAALLTYFVTVKKTAAVGLTLFALIAGAKVMYDRYNFGKMPSFNRNYLMPTQLSQSSTGRMDKIVTLIEDLCVPPGIQPNIPILVGPPGVGKTQCVQEFAAMIAKGQIPRLSHKSVFTVNAADLVQHGGWSDGGEYASRLEKLFRDLEGKENAVVLFFDEIHNAATSDLKGNSGNVIESLKTKLIDKNITCVFATTQEEYDAHIKPNQAIVDRTDLILFDNLSDETTKHILNRQFLLEDNAVAVTPEAIDEVIRLAGTREEYASKMNPRKSIRLLSKAIGRVWGWIPTKLAKKMEALTLEVESLKLALIQQADTDLHWDKDLSLHLPLLAKIEELEDTRKMIDEQKKLHTQFVNLQNLQKTYNRRRNTLVHNLTSPKDFLWTHFVVLPALDRLVKDTINQFKQEFDEDIPEKVTAEVVKSLFPEN